VPVSPRKPAEKRPVSLVAATEASFAAAEHLTGEHAGAMKALLMLAAKIDAWNVIVVWANEDAADSGGRPLVPANDNVSISAYLKGMEQLGLTPSGRAALDKAKPAQKGADVVPEEDKLAKVARLRAVSR